MEILKVKKEQYRVLFVEDNDVEKEIISSMIKNEESLILAETVSSCQDVLSFLQNHTVDLLIMDIDLPDGSSIDLIVKEIDNIDIIFITAHDNFAVKAFDVGAVDYILKPVTEGRFKQAMERLRKIEKTNKLKRIDSVFKYHFKSKHYLIPLENIYFIKANGRNVVIHGRDDTSICPYSISTMLEKLESSIFMRIHKSYIINLSYINKLYHEGSGHYHVVLADGDDNVLPVGRKYAKELRDYIK